MDVAKRLARISEIMDDLADEVPRMCMGSEAQLVEEHDLLIELHNLLFPDNPLDY